MISADANYSYIADVHVPAYCNIQRDYLKGCMNPAALNYNPVAVQSDHCQFPTLGCTISTSVNYNPEATVNDGRCIARVVGCTVSIASYVGGGNPDTPGYRSLRFGDNVRASSRPYHGPQVVESMSSANSMRGVDGPGCDHRILATITASRSASAVKPSPAKTRPPPAAERALSVAAVAAAI
jgi:hypothetical protein